jgi:hypothetical protein
MLDIRKYAPPTFASAMDVSGASTLPMDLQKRRPSERSILEIRRQLLETSNRCLVQRPSKPVLQQWLQTRFLPLVLDSYLSLKLSGDLPHTTAAHPIYRRCAG